MLWISFPNSRIASRFRLRTCSAPASESVGRPSARSSRSSLRRGLVAGSGAQRTVRLTRRADAAVSRRRNHSDGQPGRKTVHGMDAARQHEPRHADKRTRSGAAIRGSDHQHSGVLESLPSLRTDREAAKCGLGVQRLHRQLCAGAFRDTRDVRVAVGKGVLPPCPPPLRFGRSSRCCAREHLTLLDRNRRALPRLLRPRQPVPSPRQFGCAQSVHRRLLRHHHPDLSLPLSMEQAGRAAAQRGRNPGAPHLHRCVTGTQSLDG